MRNKRVITSKLKIVALAKAVQSGQREISLWRDEEGTWHVAKGAKNVPAYAVEVYHHTGENLDAK